MPEVPAYVQGSPLIGEAYELAADAHSGPGRKKGTDLAHPIAVGMLLHERGYDDEVIAAGLLHDVLEDTDADVSEIAERFGPGVAALVTVLTEDASIPEYEDRKAEHRERVAGGGQLAAAIYAADKLAKMRGIREDGVDVPDEKLEHYRQTLVELRGAHPELPFLADLEGELRAADGRRERVGRR
ncbi:MAG: HD domain-containing protein [Solirubrobacterales bacterium]